MHIFRMYWLRSFRKPGAIVLWLALPFVFMTIYQLAFGDDDSTIPKTGLAVVDQDSTLVSGLAASAFEQGPLEGLIQVYKAVDMAEVELLFAEGKASAALILPDGFTSSLLDQTPDTLVLLTNPRHYIGPQIADGVVGSVVAMVNGLIGAFETPLGLIHQSTQSGHSPTSENIAEISNAFFDVASKAPTFSAITQINVEVVADEKSTSATSGFNMVAMFFPGLIMFGLLSVSLSIETRLLYDRQRHITRRLVTAPVAAWNLVLQQRLYAASFLYIVAVVTAVLGAIVWKIPPVGLATANVICIALVLFVSGINGSIFGLSSSVKATSAISSFVMMIMLIVGGGFYPAEMAPPTFQQISRLIPTGIANIGLTRVLTGRDAGISIPFLLLYSSVFFGISLALARRRLTS